MKLEIDSKGVVNGLRCSYCNSYNDILTAHCWNCNTYNHDNHIKEYAAKVTIKRLGLTMTAKRSKEEQEQLYINLYNRGTALAVEKASFAELDAYIDELEDIASEARITLRAAHDVRREKAAKLSKDDRDKLLTKEDTGSDKILKPRAKPKTTADKLALDMAGLGLTPEQIAAAMSHVKPKAREIPDKDIPQLQDKRPPTVITFERRAATAEVVNGKLVNGESKSIKTNQGTLLNECLGLIDWGAGLSSLQEKLNTAELLLAKAQKESADKGEIFEIPESLIMLRARISELAPKVPSEPIVEEVKEDKPKIFNPFAKK